jgi:hypothetical protein
LEPHLPPAAWDWIKAHCPARPARIDSLKHIARSEMSTFHDPLAIFYEKYLQAYNPRSRKSGGVFYTPPEIVRFMVRVVDQHLREEFGLQQVAPDGAVFDETFFMYGDDLDLCIRVARAGWRIVYDGRVQITHLKGVSVARDFERMSRAIFDANRDVYLKHFNPRGSALVRWKYVVAFGVWKWVGLLRARLRGSRRVRPI